PVGRSPLARPLRHAGRPGPAGRLRLQERGPPAMTPNKLRDPRGFTLVEVITAVTLTTLLIGLAIGMMNVVFRVEQAGRRRMVESNTTAQLARSFRDDARSAIKAETA